MTTPMANITVSAIGYGGRRPRHLSMTVGVYDGLWRHVAPARWVRLKGA